MYKQITYDQAEQLISGHQALIIADIRDLDSYEVAHINNAIHLSIPKLQEFCDHTDKYQPILVYCYHGISSQSVAQHLLDQGFAEVYSLIGGFEAWKSHHRTSDHDT